MTTVACDTARALSRALSRSEWDAIFRDAQAAPVACPGPTPGGLGGPFPLCNGSSPGEVRSGFAVVRHGSEGSTYNAADFRSEVVRAVGDPQTLRLASVGCPALGPCDRFVVVFSTGRQPQVVYFSFDTRSGPPAARLTAFGVSGDNAATILAARDARTVLGETRFTPYMP